MIEVMEPVYARLAGSVSLTDQLAAPGGVPAIYTEWAAESESPYIILTYPAATFETPEQVGGTLQVDIFDSRSEGGTSLRPVLDIRDSVIAQLDGYRHDYGGSNLRLFLQSEQPFAMERGRSRRYVIEFNYRYNRLPARLA